MTRAFSGIEVIWMFAGLTLAIIVLSIAPMRDLSIPVSIALVFSMVGWIMWRDIVDFIIPDGPLVSIGLVAGALRLVAAPDGFLSEAMSIGLDVAACGGAFWLMREAYFRLRGIDGIGFGDVKLAAAAGILVGMVGFAWSVFAASAVGLVFVLAASLVRPQVRFDRLPFGAFLAPACTGFWLVEMAWRP